MLENFSFYDLLGVPSSASTDEIKRAYKECIAKYHPDVNTAGNAQALLMLFNEAWKVLSDAERRRDYDATIPTSAKDFRRYRRLLATPAAEAGSGTQDETTHRIAREMQRALRYVEGVVARIVERAAELRRNWGRRHVLGVSGVAGLLIVVAVLLAIRAGSLVDESAEAAFPTATETLAAVSSSSDPGTATLPVTPLQPPSEGVLCRRALISDVSDNGASVSTSDGTLYSVAAEASGRVKVASWGTGDRVVVCASGQSASIENPAQGDEVQAMLQGTIDARSVRCTDRNIVNVGDDGATISASDGTSYAVAAQALGRVKAASWSTGDRVVVCISGSSASIDNPARYEKVQATVGGTLRAAAVRCSNQTIANVRDDGAKVSTSGGTSYAVASQGLGRAKAARWNTGDRVVVCTSGSSASVENTAHDAKVQATVEGTVDAPAVRCGSRTIVDVGENGAVVTTSGGASYRVGAQALGQENAAGWGIGDRIILCTSGSSASIENPAHGDKVQAARRSSN